MTIECPQGLLLNVHSSRGGALVEEGAELTFVGCDVMTVASRAVAATGPMPIAYLDDYMGQSTGTLRFINSRLLLPSEVLPYPPLSPRRSIVSCSMTPQVLKPSSLLLCRCSDHYTRTAVQALGAS